MPQGVDLVHFRECFRCLKSGRCRTLSGSVVILTSIGMYNQRCRRPEARGWDNCAPMWLPVWPPPRAGRTNFRGPTCDMNSGNGFGPAKEAMEYPQIKTARVLRGVLWNERERERVREREQTHIYIYIYTEPGWSGVESSGFVLSKC